MGWEDRYWLRGIRMVWYRGHWHIWHLLRIDRYTWVSVMHSDGTTKKSIRIIVQRKD